MSVENTNAVARDAALEAVAQLEVGTTGLVRYTSKGEVLVIGNDEAVEMAPRLSEHDLKVQVLLTEGEDQPGLPSVPQGGRKLELNGYLGAFSVELGEPGQPNYEVLRSDIVLDLSKKPLLETPIPPPGYFAANADDELSVAEAIDQLVHLKGTFEKPRYFDYDASICHHARSGVEACRQCLDHCPAEAIISIGEEISVNPNLCQGGGVCATVCPTGAIRYTYPSREDNLKRLHTLLDCYRQNGGQEPHVTIVAEEDLESASSLPSNHLTMVFEELASVGLEVWLMALSLGAKRVHLLKPWPLPGTVDDALTEQLQVADDILQGLGYSAGMVGFYNDHSTAKSMPDIAVSPLPALTGKRPFAYFAIDHLYRQAAEPNDMIKLGLGSPFGRIQVRNSDCTLCLACTSVCPSQAIRAGDDRPRLVFHESQCVQCGMCAEACPEKAITLEPRLIADAEQRRRTEILNEDEPFCCVECGKPFGSRQAINLILGKLSGHAMFQTERAQRRLKMCDDCRVVDVVQDAEAMGDDVIRNNPTH